MGNVLSLNEAFWSHLKSEYGKMAVLQIQCLYIHCKNIFCVSIESPWLLKHTVVIVS